jgi:1,4-alpha-glucan branching enzyme
MLHDAILCVIETKTYKESASMLEKKNGKGKSVKVTFSLPAEIQGETICLVGDFNNWDESSLPMHRNGDDSFSITLELEKGREYQFRYLVNGSEWHNDWQADNYFSNPFSGDNSVVTT